MNVIQIQNLHVNYGKIQALDNVNFNIKHGEFLGIIGPNGGGKTTLIKTILGMIEPSKGKIITREETVIGYVPQLTTFDRKFPITVGEVIKTGHLPKKAKPFYKYSKEANHHVLEVMRQLDIAELFDRQIGQLSGGQMQKVLIARSLMNHPNVLILDEPTAGVDENSRAHIFEMLQQLNKDITIIIISHNITALSPYLDRIIYINKQAHVHSDNHPISGDVMDGDMCPIDWFIQGEKITKNEAYQANDQKKRRQVR